MSTTLELLALAQLAFWNNKPTAELFNTSNSFSVPNNNFVPITWNNAADDNWGGHSNATNPSRYTAQVAGLYRFSGALSTAATAGAGYRLIGWYYNGAEYTFGSRIYFSNPSTTVINTVASPSITIRMNVGDYVEMYVFQNSGAAISATDGTFMQVEFVHF